MKIAGLEVEDANEPLTITVTKSDVRIGAKKNADTCAMAQALCRQTGATAAKVHFSRAYIKMGKKWQRFGVPLALRSEVLAFDRGGAFAPGEYVLSPLQPTVRLDYTPTKKRGARHKEKRTPQRGNKPRRPYHVVSGVRAKMMADWE